MPAGPLTGVSVLDATQVMAGPFCTLLLADMGAEVIKIEKPSGDDSRRMGPPFINGESAAFLGINRNKKSCVLDLKRLEHRDAFKHMARSVDIVVENFRPGTMDRLGLGSKELRTENPGLIYASVSGFGQTGPYGTRPGYDLIAQGMSGIMSVTGHPNAAPVKVSVPLADLNAGMFAAYGILSAYIHKLKTGEGQDIDTSLLEAGIAYTVWESAELWGTGMTPEPKGSAHRLVAPYQAIAASDGYFNIAVANQATWERLCAALDREDLVDDPRFMTNPDRITHYQELAVTIEATTIERTRAEWIDLLGSAGVPSGPIYNMSEVFEDPQVNAREMLIELEHPIAGTVKHIGVPVKLSATPGGIRYPAPTLGQHSIETFERFGFSSKEITALAL